MSTTDPMHQARVKSLVVNFLLEMGINVEELASLRRLVLEPAPASVNSVYGCSVMKAPAGHGFAPHRGALRLFKIPTGADLWLGLQGEVCSGLFVSYPSEPRLILVKLPEKPSIESVYGSWPPPLPLQSYAWARKPEPGGSVRFEIPDGTEPWLMPDGRVCGPGTSYEKTCLPPDEPRLILRKLESEKSKPTPTVGFEMPPKPVSVGPQALGVTCPHCGKEVLVWLSTL